jgi:hypothetical protein
MVYRSYGKEVPQTQIWPSIAKPNRAGSLASTTHLMARDALTRCFSATSAFANINFCLFALPDTDSIDCAVPE